MRGIRRSAREQAAVTVATAPPVSPELSLVCPDLREQALALLPTVDPDALFRRVPRPVAPVRAFVQDALIESFADPPDVPSRSQSRSTRPVARCGSPSRRR